MSNTLKIGSEGAEVRALQHALNARPYLYVVEDGIFGPRTDEAVRQFQGRAHLVADGVVGPKTDAMLWTRVVFADATLQAPIAAGNAGSQGAPLPNRGSGSPGTPAGQNTSQAPTNRAGVIQQVSLGTQVNLAPWILRPAPAPGTPSGPIWSGVVSYALVYRTASQGPHVEFALNPQFQVNSRVQSTDPRWTMQVNGQVMFADLVAPGRWHFISPYLQGSAGLSLVPNGAFGAGFAIGDQVSFDLVPDRLQINLQAGVGAQWANIGRSDAAFSVLGMGALGATVQF